MTLAAPRTLGNVDADLDYQRRILARAAARMSLTGVARAQERINELLDERLALRASEVRASA